MRFRTFEYTKGFLASTVVIVGIWYSTLAIWPEKSYLLPWPHEVGKAIICLLPFDSSFRSDFFDSLARTISGFLLGNVLAFPVGFFMSRFRLVKMLFAFPIDFFRSLPAVVFLPLLIAFISPKGPIHIAVITIPVFLVMTLNFLYGLERGSNLRKNVASKLGLDKRDIFIKIELRETLPEIVTGWRISISLALILAIVAEMFFPSEGGIGAYIYYSSQNVNKNAELWAAIALLGSLGFLLNRIFIWIDSRYCFWRGK